MRTRCRALADSGEPISPEIWDEASASAQEDVDRVVRGGRERKALGRDGIDLRVRLDDRG
jgi:hypothetical protein